MQPKVDDRSPFLRFFDAFFQEQSIKWILAVGMLILLGSSLMLVTSHWDTYTPIWKYLILLGYTGGIHVAGQVAFHSLGLRKTGTGLMALTVLLLPLTFLSLRWFHAGDLLSLAGLTKQGGLLVLLGINVVFAAFAAARIFRHFLRETQPTFIASYVLLCFAGALVPALPASAALWEAFALWTMFAIGAMKVNRHVFWLTEAYRQPRIYGFFPILLLGGQFLLLFTVGLTAHVSLEWIGFGCVLTAIPVLLTADSLARVFLQIHGQVTRPLPWSIVLPTFIGLSLTTAGVCLAGLRFPNAGVLVPTAALAAVLLAVVAHRTQSKGFVWGMLLGTMLAYQCTPVFFRELAVQVVQHGAAAVHEKRLPLAFYGLSYFPLLAVTSVCAALLRRRNRLVFAAPFHQFSVGMAVLLLGVSLTHAKATLPVSLALTALFAGQSLLFHSRRVLTLAVVATLFAAHGFSSFATSVMDLAPTREFLLLPWAVAGGLLLVVSRFVDARAANWLPPEEQSAVLPICQTASLWVVLITAASWLGRSLFGSGHFAPAYSGGITAVLLLLHAASRNKSLLWDVSLGFGVVYVVMQTLAAGWGPADALTLATCLLTVLWLGACWLKPEILRAPIRGFAESGGRVSRTGFLMIFVSCLIPLWSMAIFVAPPFQAWTASIVITLWAFAEARRRGTSWLTAVGWVGLLATEGVTLINFWRSPGTTQWLPALWSAMALLAMPFVRRRQHVVAGGRDDEVVEPRDVPARISATAYPVSVCAQITQGAIACASLVIFTTPIRVAGAVALVGLLALATIWRHSTMRRVALMLVNWQVLCGVLQCFAPDAKNLLQLTLHDFAPAALPVALLAAIQSFTWNRHLVARRDGMEDLAVMQYLLLDVAAGASLLAAFARQSNGLALWEALFAIGTFACLAAGRVLSALRYGEPLSSPEENSPLAPRVDGAMSDVAENERLSSAQSPRGASGRHCANWQLATVNVWMAIALSAACVAYLAAFGVITFGHGISMFAVLAAGFCAWGIGQTSARSVRALVLAGPFQITGSLLPALTVLLALAHHFDQASSWLGANSLALLLAAGFYFWQGLENKQTALVIVSSAILNVALALLWDELSWSDLQFFMIPLGISVLGLVELLQKEIPERAHNPLRYAGALLILVSPTFHITGGSWVHLFSLLVASVAVTLVAMGLRIRALMYTGTAFLLADLTAMVVRGSIDNPNVLWIAGIVLGCLVIGLAAYCERYREVMLQRLRLLAAELETWR